MANGTDLFAFSLPRSHWIVTGSVCNFRVVICCCLCWNTGVSQAGFLSCESEFFSQARQNSSSSPVPEVFPASWPIRTSAKSKG